MHFLLKTMQGWLVAVMLVATLPWAALAQTPVAQPAITPVLLPTPTPTKTPASAPALAPTVAPTLAPTSLPTLAPTPAGVVQSPLPQPSAALTVPVVAGYPSAALVDEVLANMTVADRVGQLFLITFRGSDTGFDSDIAELIYGYRVGGVALSPGNGNFSNEKGVDTPRQVASLVNRLQGLAYGVLLPEERALEALPAGGPWSEETLMQEMTNVSPLNLPLFIAAEQEGDNLPATMLRRGFTPLPSQMALGAAWNPELANAVGRIAGRELNAVGVNMLLGPNLDVLEQPLTGQVGALGIHMFGGDPFWVGQMGRAYIAGIHAGSARRIATIARSFPGAGDVDRLPDEEVATVQRSLEELRRVTLPPFLSVTRLPADAVAVQAEPSATDGLMSSHVRYSAFQGTSLGRNTPIGLAPELNMVLEQEGFAGWRSQGGLMVSGGLGSPAIRRHYGAASQEFPFRRIALDAFTAGHDLLYLNHFGSNAAGSVAESDEIWETEKHNIQETIGFFQERYVNDPEFAQRVDQSVRRIVRLKLSLYAADLAPALTETVPADAAPTDAAPTEVAPAASAGNAAGEAAPPAEPAEPALPLSAILVQESDLAALSPEAQAAALAQVGQVARESISLLYPDPSNAGDVVSRVPQAGEQLLVFTDSRLLRDCDACMTEAAVGPDEISQIILRLYGPDATGQIAAEQINSRTFADLDELLDAELLDAALPPAPETATPEITPLPTLEAPTEATGTEALPPAALGAGDAVADADLDKNAKTAKLIDDADWIIFAMLDVNPEQYAHSDAVKRFLRQRSEDLASKNVVVLALNAPYFLDGTEISKLNAYYGVYSKAQPFLEGAVRALFRAYTPEGAPSVSVAGTRFAALPERLAPDPARLFDLRVLAADGSAIAAPNLEQAPPPAVAVGDMIRLQAGPVFDLNGNPIGDGKIVEFLLAFQGDESAPRVEMVAVRNGIATRDLLMERGGLLQVTARAGAATAGEAIALSVQGEPAAAVAAPVAAETTAAPAVAAPTAVSLAAEPAAPAADPGAALAVVEVQTPAPVGLASLIIALLTIVATLSMVLIALVRVAPRRTLVHSLLWAVNCGLLAYILYGLGLLPGAAWLQASLRIWGAALVVFIAMLAPLLWLQLRAE